MAIQRHKALQPLSRQHHQGLLVSVLIDRGIKKDAMVKELREFILQFWEEDLLSHFDSEEQVLMPFANQYPALLAPLNRMTTEHQDLRSLVDRIYQDTEMDSFEIISGFSAALEAHIRYEERELFNAIQDRLTKEEMSLVDSALAGVEERDFCIKYPNKFWE